MEIKTNVIITGIICLTALEGLALYLGYDGYILAAVVGVIGAAIGVAIPSDIFKKK